MISLGIVGASIVGFAAWWLRRHNRLAIAMARQAEALELETVRQIKCLRRGVTDVMQAWSETSSTSD